MDRSKLLALAACLALSGCKVGVIKPLWECQTKDGETVVIIDAADPAEFGGTDAEGWQWGDDQIKVCRETTRALAAQQPSGAMTGE